MEWALKDKLIFLLYVFVLILVAGHVNETVNKSFRRNSSQTVMKHMYTPLLLDEKQPKCFFLKPLKFQYRLCKKETNLSSIIIAAKNLAISYCEEEFQYSYWNCTRSPKIFKHVYRETAFMQALSASALAYTVARACAESQLSKCDPRLEPDKASDKIAWKWGFYDDNLKYGKRFTKRFFRLQQHTDEISEIWRHNTKVGFEALKNQNICKCLGMTGSCTQKVCWRRINQFKETAKILKDKYHKAFQFKLRNNTTKRLIISNKNGSLLYLKKSPDYCKRTTGRRCLNQENCATLCCGRGFNVQRVLKKRLCNCRLDNTDLKYDLCEFYENEYTCK